MMEKADYKIKSGWGDSIQWSDPKQFSTDFDGNTIFRVVGWQSTIPEVGQNLSGEFNNSFILFEFVDVERMGDPPDMFFANVKPVKQEMKETI